MKALALGVVLAALAVPAAAQDTDARWTGWLGCWELITDDERGDAPVPAAAAIDRALGFDRPLPAPRAGAGDPSTPRVCVSREGEGVSITTSQGETVVLQQTIVADGRTQAVGGVCPGTRRAEWSDGRPHLLSHAEFTCADAPSHAGSALAFITADGTWLDIETVRTGGREALRVRRYQPLRNDGAGSRVVLGAPLTLADVQTLSTRLPAPIVEAAIVESRAVLPVGAKDVVALADRGVPERVIDLLVALAYPQTFVVERRAVAAPAGFGGSGGLSSADAWRYYAPMAFSMPGFYADPDFYFFRATPGVLILDGGGGWAGGGGGGIGVAPPPATAVGSPQAINDLGYTRVRPREVDTPTPQRRPVSSNTGGVVTGPATAATSPGSSGGASDGGGGATASPGGYSSGGGSDTGRTAVPR